jgi:PAS domain S-box-containing protein
VRKHVEPNDPVIRPSANPPHAAVREASASFRPPALAERPPVLASIAQLAALAERWQGSADARTIAAELADALRDALGLDAVAVQVEPAAGARGVFELATADPAVDAALRDVLGNGADDGEGSGLRDPRDGGSFLVQRLPLGPDGRHGQLIACSREPGFPQHDDRLVLQTAASQAAAALGHLQAVAGFAAERARWRITLDGISDAVISTDAAARIECFNAAAAALTGTPADEAIGRSADDVLVTRSPVTQRQLDSALVRSLQVGHPVASTRYVLLQPRDGNERPIDEQASPIHADDGSVVGAVTVFRDATDRLHAEALHARLLREAETQRERQAQAFQLAPSFMALMRGRRHIFELANERYYQLIGRRDIIGRPIREALPELEGQGIFEMLDEVFATGEVRIENARSVRVQRAASSPPEERILDFVYQPLRTPDGSLSGILVHGIDLTDRVRAETALRERDQRLQLFLDNASDYGVIITDRDGGIIEWLGGAEQITGWTAEEAIGQRSALIFTDADRALGRPERELAVAAEQGRAEDRRWHRRRDGSLFYADGVAVALREASGELKGFGKLFRDVTARKRAEDELAQVRAESERRRRLYEATLSNTPDLVFVLDLEHRFIYANEALQRTWARDWNEAIGRTFEQLDYPEASARQLDIDTAHAIRSRSPVRGEVAYIGNHGRRIHEYILAPVIGAEGEVEAVAGTSRDITVHKRSEERFALVAAASHRINASLAMARIARTVAEEARRIIGARQATVNVQPPVRSGGDVVRGEAVDRGHPELVAHAAQLAGGGLEDAVRERRQPLRLSAEALRRHPAWASVASGDAVPNGWLAAPLLGHGGQCLGTLQVADRLDGDFSEEDESVLVQLAAVAAVGLENARLYEVLRITDRRKDEFLAMLAHELRNPLAPMRYALEVMRASPDRQAREEAREMMARQLGQMVRLVEDLLDVARISVGKLQLHRERVVLDRVVAIAVETSRPAIDARRHRLLIDLPQEPLYLDADSTRLAQALLNLLNNAAKYTQPGGRIELQAERAGDWVLIRVVDDGIGIPAHLLTQVFEPFSQIERSGAGSEGGLGIGLTLVRRLVDLHGGTIEAHSAGLGHGSEFLLRLPLAAQQEPAPPPEVDATAPAAGGRRVLVVDDNRDAASSLAFLLAAQGHEARAVHDGSDALDLASAFRPEVVVLDIGMPGLSGYDVARRLRAMPETCDVVLIALTGWGQDSDRRASRDAGFDHHLVKPADLGELQHLVASARHA